LASRKPTQKQDESAGILSSLWPFGSKDAKNIPTNSNPQSATFVSQIDDSLKQKGIDDAARQAAVKPLPADLPKDDTPKTPSMDTAVLLSSIDTNLKKSGTNVNEPPPPPEAAEAFRNAAATQAIIAKAAAESQPPRDVQSSGILGSIDQKLKAQGVEPVNSQPPPTSEVRQTAPKPAVKSVELEPKLAVEKGPLFLSPIDAPVPSPEKAASNQDTNKPDAKLDATEGSKETPSRVLVKGPVQTQPTAAQKTAERTRLSSAQDDEPKGVFDQIRQDMEKASKALNPFSW
jgi:hypothetical protein